MDMESYQIRGILVHQFTLEQVGISISKNNFIQQAPSDHHFSEMTVNALDAIKSQNLGIAQQDALDILNTLSSTQVKGLVLYNLSLQQVCTKEFQYLEDTILIDLANSLSKDIVDFELPLPVEIKELVGKKLDKLLEKAKTQNIQETQETIPVVSMPNAIANASKVEQIETSVFFKGLEASKPNANVNTKRNIANHQDKKIAAQKSKGKTKLKI